VAGIGVQGTRVSRPARLRAPAARPGRSPPTSVGWAHRIRPREHCSTRPAGASRQMQHNRSPGTIASSRALVAPALMVHVSSPRGCGAVRVVVAAAGTYFRSRLAEGHTLLVRQG
jgi:hypothetical protein